MPKSKFDFVKSVKIPLIIYAVILVLAVVFGLIWGINLDINFKGGSRFTYTYTGEIDLKEAKSVIESTISKKVTVDQSSSISGDSTKLVISLVKDESLSTEMQKKITASLQEKYKDNDITLGDSTTVSPTFAGSFFAKSLFAVSLAAVLVIIYVGIRFRKIGGVSAAITALGALVLDIIAAFAVCIIFRLQIDTNFMAVILTILGYSLNDTIVIYDRIRENRKFYPSETVYDVVNTSLSETMRRNIFTSVTTTLAIVTIIVVSELAGLTSLRTFAIPMAVGVISGCFSSMCVSGPLWVKWKERLAKKK
jgi:preprotein translocase SecF subunit